MTMSLAKSGIAKALNEDTYTHPELVRVVENFYGFNSSLTISDPRTRLARVPKSSELVYGIDNWTGRQSYFPVVKVLNIYALPGVPRLFRTSFEIIREHLRDPRIQFHSRSLFVTLDENCIATFLVELAQKYKGDVNIGSYPAFNNSYYRVRIVLDSQSAISLNAAYEEAKQFLCSAIISYEPNPIVKACQAVYELAKEDSPLGCHVAKSIGIIESALDQYTPPELVVGFNGGKDCTVLLHLIYAVYCHRSGHKLEVETDTGSAPVPSDLPSFFPNLMYIRSRSVFPELENFVQQTLQFYHLSASSIWRPTSNLAEQKKIPVLGGLIIYEGEIKGCLADLLKDFPKVRGVFMGTRHSDPRSAHLTSMCMTDTGWPQVLRINPLLEWTYEDVWQFLRQLSLPYCSLYDVGYTSIGSMEDTHPNPELRYVTESGRTGYRPAYLLTDSSLERSGRRRRLPNSTGHAPNKDPTPTANTS
ncbi:unnamed protein product [Calicophoron daubneyi]|uniref:FAD synthase n=1 Tax=Calicophoron daubneyi TaxID=300641 RepID=A0AAV2TZC9_CALDB